MRLSFFLMAGICVAGCATNTGGDDEPDDDSIRQVAQAGGSTSGGCTPNQVITFYYLEISSATDTWAQLCGPSYLARSSTGYTCTPPSTNPPMASFGQPQVAPYAQIHADPISGLCRAAGGAWQMPNRYYGRVYLTVWNASDLRSGSAHRIWGENYGQAYFSDVTNHGTYFGPDFSRRTYNVHRGITFNLGTNGRWTDQMEYGYFEYFLTNSTASVACAPPGPLGSQVGQRVSSAIGSAVPMRYMTCSNQSIFAARPVLNTGGVNLNFDYYGGDTLGTYLGTITSPPQSRTDAQWEQIFRTYAAPDGPQIN